MNRDELLKEEARELEFRYFLRSYLGIKAEKEEILKRLEQIYTELDKKEQAK